MSRRLPVRNLSRIFLALVAAGQAEVGVWGIAAPRSFFDQFPGFGHHWVVHMGTYNEHLVRDYAAAELGFAALLVCAAIWFERRLVLGAAIAFLAATLPHFAYHLTTTHELRTSDNVASLALFVIEMVVVAVALVTVVKTEKGAADAPYATRQSPRVRSLPPTHV